MLKEILQFLALCLFFMIVLPIPLEWSLVTCLVVFVLYVTMGNKKGARQ